MGRGGQQADVPDRRQRGGFASFIHVEDAAGATLAAIEEGRTGVFNIVDDEPAPVSEWLPYLAELLGAKPPRHVPVWLGKVLAGEALATMMTEGRVRRTRRQSASSVGRLSIPAGGRVSSPL